MLTVPKKTEYTIFRAALSAIPIVLWMVCLRATDAYYSVYVLCALAALAALADNHAQGQLPQKGAAIAIAFAAALFSCAVLLANYELVQNSSREYLLAIPVLLIVLTLWVATPVYSEFRYAYSVFTVFPFYLAITAESTPIRKKEVTPWTTSQS